MRKVGRSHFLAGLVLFGLGLATGLVAQPKTDIPQRAEQKRTDLSGAPGMEVIASIVEVKPGESLDLHFHHGVEAAYIIQGTSVQTPGKDPAVLSTGTTVLNLRDAKHGALKNVSDTPLKIFAVHVVDKGKPLYDFSK